jgi:hypothetical protein
LRRVARFDGVDWQPFGDGLDGEVWALTTYDDGAGPALYLGGKFKSAGGSILNGIARWNGTELQPLGEGTDRSVYALAVFDDGRGPALYAGGDFTTAGTSTTFAIARWDGAKWESVGGGLTENPWSAAFALRTFDDGTGTALYVGGNFDHAGQVATANIAKWNGSTWSALGSGTSGWVNALTSSVVSGVPTLYAGGTFSSIGGVSANRIARWTGVWSALGSGLSAGDLHALSPWSSGALLAGGEYPNLAQRWNGSTWSSLASGSTSVQTTAISSWDDGRGAAAYFGGSFSDLGTAAGDRISRWNGSSWSGLGTGISSGSVSALATAEEMTGSALYLGGSFSAVNGVASGNLARWSRPLVCGDTSGPAITILEPAAGG